MIVLEAQHLEKSFFSHKKGKTVHAVSDVSFSLEQGEFLGVVGPSGCGKSTLAKIVCGLQPADSGELRILDQVICYPYPKETYRSMQMVFQMPQESFDPRVRVGRNITDIQMNFGVPKNEAEKNTYRLLDRVGLSSEYYNKRSKEMSGGECQRAALARTLAVSPRILICDEITSALDVSVQAQILELLKELKSEFNLSALFISHDIALVQGLCDNMMVMQEGKVVEYGRSSDIIRAPSHPFTSVLLDAVLEV